MLLPQSTKWSWVGEEGFPAFTPPLWWMHARTSILSLPWPIESKELIVSTNEKGMIGHSCVLCVSLTCASWEIETYRHISGHENEHQYLRNSIRENQRRRNPAVWILDRLSLIGQANTYCQPQFMFFSLMVHCWPIWSPV